MDASWLLVLGLTVVWHDSVPVFPRAGLPALGREIENLFEEQEISVRFHVAAENENLQPIPEPRVNVIVLPQRDLRFGPENAMAVVLGTRGSKYGIFLFYSEVRRTLGHDHRETSPRHLAELSRALARVIAHEVVHVLAPDGGHAESGLMSGKLTRKALLAERIALDPSSLERALETVQAWREPEPPEVVQPGSIQAIVGGGPSARAQRERSESRSEKRWGWGPTP
jgi:hypothetical protein